MKKVLLIILDGFGYSEKKEHNAIEMANAPTFKKLLKTESFGLLKNNGLAVGLPEGVMGNSEVGHLNLGAGRVVYQDLTRISKFSQEIGFQNHDEIKKIASNPKGALHLLGLVSDGGVHSDQKHLYELIKAIHKISKDKPVFIHMITDGRDTPPKSGAGFAEELEAYISKYPNTQMATVLGRFYAMDRDKRWERVEEAYRALTEDGVSEEFDSAKEAIADAYKNEETDEFIKPRHIRGGVRISQQDQVVFFNYRADRAREISQALAVIEFKDFPTQVKVDAKNFLTMTRYQKDFPFPILFEQQSLKNILGEVVANRKKKQLRIAETEKYAHVTYFFNGGVEKPFEGEERILIDSPKDVKTYDEKPEMSAFEVTKKLVKELDQNYTLVVVNYANGDMVGHTGDERAAVKAIEALDECVEMVLKKALENDYHIIITADHGNCEEMIDESGEPMTQHSMNLVPVFYLSRGAKHKLKNGSLCDVAPTILDILDWDKPKEMDGQSLLLK